MYGNWFGSLIGRLQRTHFCSSCYTEFQPQISGAFPIARPTDPNTWCSRCQLNATGRRLPFYMGVSCLSWLLGLVLCTTFLGVHRATGWSAARSGPCVYRGGTTNSLGDTISMLAHSASNYVLDCVEGKGEVTNQHRMIGQAWARPRVYVRMAWRELSSQVRLHRFSLLEATDRMADMFGSNGKIWSLQDIELQISPVPPRPP